MDIDAQEDQGARTTHRACLHPDMYAHAHLIA